jgi:preprotein translocase subunit YajC
LRREKTCANKPPSRKKRNPETSEKAKPRNPETTTNKKTMTQIILAAQAAQGGGSMTSFLIMMVAIFAIMYFFMIRPQQKRQKEIQNFQNTLQEGTAVVTGGGIYGTVKKIDLAAGIIEVKIADGVVIKVDKGYVFKDNASTPMQK